MTEWHNKPEVIELDCLFGDAHMESEILLGLRLRGHAQGYSDKGKLADFLRRIYRLVTTEELNDN